MLITLAIACASVASCGSAPLLRLAATPSCCVLLRWGKTPARDRRHGRDRERRRRPVDLIAFARSCMPRCRS